MKIESTKIVGRFVMFSYVADVWAEASGYDVVVTGADGEDVEFYDAIDDAIDAMDAATDSGLKAVVNAVAESGERVFSFEPFVSAKAA